MKSLAVYSIRDLKEGGIHKLKVKYINGSPVRIVQKYGGIYYSNKNVFISYEEAFKAAINKLNQEKNKIDVLKSILIHNSTRRKIKRFIRCRKVRMKSTMEYLNYYNDGKDNKLYSTF